MINRNSPGRKPVFSRFGMICEQYQLFSGIIACEDVLPGSLLKVFMGIFGEKETVRDAG